LAHFTLPLGPVRIRPKEGQMKTIAESKMTWWRIDPRPEVVP